MAELADALDSKSSGRKVVGVRFPPLVLHVKISRNKHLHYLPTFGSAARSSNHKTVSIVWAFMQVEPRPPENGRQTENL